MSAFHCKYCGGTERHDRRVCRAKALWQDPEFRARNAAGVRAELARRWQDPEFRARNAAGARQNWQDPAFRERNAAATRQNWQDPAFRERQAAGTRQNWKDPAFRERHVSGVRAHHGGDPASLSDHGLAEYEAARAEGFSHSDAMDIARDAEAMETRQ